MDENTQSLDEKGQAVTLESESEETEIKYLSGWRLHLLTFALCLCVFLVNLEITIVSTSLVTIAESFEEFDQTNWVVSAYLVTYTSFLIPWAKFSDIFGRKWPFLQAFAIFTVFSGGCGASQSMLQL
ncbi:hypothetical protein MMC10_004104 [Thelotrema lepadinum]|nr:hypothetical protein [Thelotrema lepadinum]